MQLALPENDIFDEDEQLSHVAGVLRRRSRLLAVNVATRLLLGLPLALLGPAVLATMFWWAAAELGLTVPWRPLFGAATVVALPLLFWTELRTRGRYLCDTLAETGPPESIMRMPGAHVAMFGLAAAPILANPRGFATGVVEVFLTGPRLVVEACETVRQRRKLGAIDITRSARLVCRLLTRADGIAPAQLLEPPECIADIVPVLRWLAFHGWIGVGQRVDRVYLYSDGRLALARATRC